MSTAILEQPIIVEPTKYAAERATVEQQLARLVVQRDSYAREITAAAETGDVDRLVELEHNRADLPARIFALQVRVAWLEVADLQSRIVVADKARAEAQRNHDQLVADRIATYNRLGGLTGSVEGNPEMTAARERSKISGGVLARASNHRLSLSRPLEEAQERLQRLVARHLQEQS